ncbi:hypothetical protein DP939_10005 [Spongiactinospora rosea]|uniref:Uncharacterized protein n=2 Tax=Spongiactinospora rosea TaxID=2248750 RepID=A0A366M1T4_9ACTN|nr:hypothetical protein DP939_10005 [Spongiactinospora rosea]
MVGATNPDSAAAASLYEGRDNWPDAFITGATYQGPNGKQCGSGGATSINRQYYTDLTAYPLDGDEDSTTYSYADAY